MERVINNELLRYLLDRHLIGNNKVLLNVNLSV